MHLDLRLNDLTLSRIASIRLTSATRTLQELTGRNLARAKQGPDSPQFKNRKEEMKQRLMKRGKAVSFEQATDEDGRERLLLSLYLEYATRLDASWLPTFDEFIASSVLGENGCFWPAGRRLQATQLFFTHFGLDQLPALNVLCSRILEAYQAQDLPVSGLGAVWHQHRALIFATDGPQRIARAAIERETLAELMDRFAVPSEGRFSARLKECYLLNRLEAIELGQGQEILSELEAMRHVPYLPGIPLGAAAVRILTQRTLQAGGVWQGDWADWLLRLGSDPSIPNSAGFLKWWACWHPTPTELECARRGVNRQTLEYFIQFLDASLREEGKYEQFKDRAGFLRWLDDTRKIRRFKLMLHPRAHQNLPRSYQQQRNRIAQIEGSGQGVSVIAMECIDDVWIVEGTHSFAIRVLRGECPVPEVFLEERASYPYSRFVQNAMHRDTCTGIWKPHMGDWISDLLWQMKWKFHIEPPWTYGRIL